MGIDSSWARSSVSRPDTLLRAARNEGLSNRSTRPDPRALLLSLSKKNRQVNIRLAVDDDEQLIFCGPGLRAGRNARAATHEQQRTCNGKNSKGRACDTGLRV
jgi:hypothetical protein